jgi:hypothetical protein
MSKLRAYSLDPSAVGARLGLCAAALAGAAATVSDARATVVTFTTPIAVPNTVAGVYINFLTGASASSPGAVPGWDFNPWASSNALSFFWNNTPANSSGGVAGTTTGPYLDLAPGAVVGSLSTFSTSAAPAATLAFQSSGTHVLGFRFFNESTAAINYGYLAISTTGPSGFPAVITSWSYENSGGTMGQPIPEPSTSLMLSVGVLALGAASLRRHRRQQRALRT